ncbi:MAG: CvpA family protein [Syntrophobacterales bacterium]|jgi:membrane protein required for colicin V production|nr:CvpA family protein [Syntrophobacterales bacterium]
MFDIIVLATFGILTIIGWWKGLVKQLFGLAGMIGGFMLAMKYYQPTSKFLANIHSGPAKTISFVAIFLTCVIVAILMGRVMGKFVSDANLGFIDRTGGAVLGFLKGCIVVSVLVIILTTFLSPDNHLFKQSATIRHIRPMVATLKKVTRGDIKAKYNEKIGNEKSQDPMEK